MVKKIKNLKLVKHDGSSICIVPRKLPGKMRMANKCVWRPNKFFCDIVHNPRKSGHEKHHDCLDCMVCTHGVKLIPKIIRAHVTK